MWIIFGLCVLLGILKRKFLLLSSNENLERQISDTLLILGMAMFWYVKVKQSRYGPGVAQRVPGS